MNARTLFVLTTLSMCSCSDPRPSGGPAIARTTGALSGPGSESCAIVGAADFQRLADRIATVQALAAADDATFGDAVANADAKNVLARLAATSSEVTRMRDWLLANVLNASNASAAASIHSSLATLIPAWLDAARSAATLAANGDGTARRIFALVIDTANAANEVATQGGRCYMDWAVPAVPSNVGTGPILPASCGELDASACAPLSVLLAAASAQASADEAIDTGDVAIYGRYNAARLADTSSAVDTLRQPPGTAASPAVATAQLTGLAALSGSLTEATWWASVSAVVERSAPARASYESSEQAVEQLIALTEMAGQCVIGKGSLPPAPKAQVRAQRSNRAPTVLPDAVSLSNWRSAYDGASGQLQAFAALRTTLPQALRVERGNGGNGVAVVSIDKDDGSALDCLYRAQAVDVHPATFADYTRGASYAFVECADHTTAPGTPFVANQIAVALLSGDTQSPEGSTTIRATFPNLGVTSPVDGDLVAERATIVHSSRFPGKILIDASGAQRLVDLPLTPPPYASPAEFYQTLVTRYDAIPVRDASGALVGARAALTIYGKPVYLDENDNIHRIADAATAIFAGRDGSVQIANEPTPIGITTLYQPPFVIG